MVSLDDFFLLIAVKNNFVFSSFDVFHKIFESVLMCFQKLINKKMTFALPVLLLPNIQYCVFYIFTTNM